MDLETAIEYQELAHICNNAQMQFRNHGLFNLANHAQEKANYYAQQARNLMEIK